MPCGGFFVPACNCDVTWDDQTTSECPSWWTVDRLTSSYSQSVACWSRFTVDRLCRRREREIADQYYVRIGPEASTTAAWHQQRRMAGKRRKHTSCCLLLLLLIDAKNANMSLNYCHSNRDMYVQKWCKQYRISEHMSVVASCYLFITYLFIIGPPTHGVGARLITVAGVCRRRL